MVAVAVAVARVEVVVVVFLSNTAIVSPRWCYVPTSVRFVRMLGGLQNSYGQGASWQVIAHEGNLNHNAVSAWRTSMNTEPVALQPSGGMTSSSVASKTNGSNASSSSAAPPPNPCTSVASSPNPCSSVASSPVAAESLPCTTRCCALKLLRSRPLLQQAANLYELGALIGEGNFSHVFVAKRMHFARDEQPFNLAVKRLKSAHLAEVLCEAYVLDRCRPHRHIVQLIDVYEGSTNLLHLVFEHAGTDLSKMLAPLPTSAETRRVALHISVALLHLHSLGLVHTDLKPGNVMVSEGASGWCCRLADVGCAIEVTGLYSMTCVSVVTATAIILLHLRPHFTSVPPAFPPALPTIEKDRGYSRGVGDGGYGDGWERGWGGGWLWGKTIAV